PPPSSRYTFSTSDPNRPLNSFPTRRSSDLAAARRRPHRERRDPLAPASLGAGKEQHSFQSRMGMREPFRLPGVGVPTRLGDRLGDRKSTRLNSSHQIISYAVFCLKKKKIE